MPSGTPHRRERRELVVWVGEQLEPTRPHVLLQIQPRPRVPVDARLEPFFHHLPQRLAERVDVEDRRRVVGTRAGA